MNILPPKAESSEESSDSSVFLIEPCSILRDGIVKLAVTAGLKIAGFTGDFATAVDQVIRSKPSIVVLEISHQSSVGFGLIRDLRIQAPDVAVLVYSEITGVALVEHCLRLGARGFVSKSQPEAELVRAIQHLLSGETYLPPELSGRLLNRLVDRPSRQGDPLASLSGAEFEVFHMIGAGMSNTAIAKRLHRSIKTIETYRSRMKKKLGLETPSELAHFAFHCQSATRQGKAQEPPQRNCPIDEFESKPAVLVVDDHSICREPLVKLLEFNGFRAVAAADGVQALELTSIHDFAVILTDLMMPRLDGVGFLEAIRAREATRRIPAIVITASTDPQLTDRARKLSDQLVSKSQFDFAHLLQCTRELARSYLGSGTKRGVELASVLSPYRQPRGPSEIIGNSTTQRFT